MGSQSVHLRWGKKFEGAWGIRNRDTKAAGGYSGFVVGN